MRSVSSAGAILQASSFSRQMVRSLNAKKRSSCLRKSNTLVNGARAVSAMDEARSFGQMAPATMDTS